MKGFTILEFMIVVVFMGALAVFALIMQNKAYECKWECDEIIQDRSINSEFCVERK